MKLFGDTISRKEAEEMVEERLQALRKTFEEQGENFSFSGPELEKVRESILRIVKAQYKVLEE